MEAMRRGGLEPPLWAGGKIVEADETYFGACRKRSARLRRRRAALSRRVARSGPSGKRAIVALVERGGNVRSFHVAAPIRQLSRKIVKENIAQESPCIPTKAVSITSVGRARSPRMKP